MIPDAAAVGEEIASAVEPVPPWCRELIEVDVLAGEDVLLHRTGRHDLRRDAAGQDGAADLDQFPRMGVGRQAQHHGDATIARQRGREDLSAARARRVVVLDVVEDERLAGARPLRQSHDGAKLEVPVDLGADLGEFVLRLQRRHPAAHVAEGGRLAFDGQVVFPGLEHGAGLVFGRAILGRFWER
jgi:hypothetical protein